MSVSIEDRDENKLCLVQKMILPAQRDIAQEHHTGVLSRSSGMNASLRKQYRFVGFTGYSRPDRIKFASLRCMAKHFQCKQGRCRDELFKPGARLCIVWRFRKSGCLIV